MVLPQKSGLEARSTADGHEDFVGGEVEPGDRADGIELCDRPRQHS